MTSLKLLILLLSLFITFSEAITIRGIVQEEWAAFKQLYKKEYDGHEDNLRFNAFMDNRFMIAQHNRKYGSGVKSYSMKLNHYGDLLQHEFLIFNGYNRTASSKNGILFMTHEHLTVPSSIDWRERNLVTPVKDQGHCGSCWSFSATGALEGQHSRKTGKLISLSEQNLIDCSKDNNGCNGGLMDNAFEYIKQNHGIDTEESYPYEAKVGDCRYQVNNTGATDTGFVDIPEGDEAKLKEAIATVGPVSVAIDASHPSFRFYSEGVYDEVECSSTELDHGVLVVGYGTDEKGKDYWIVKNSWSTKWGEGGYVRMVRNKNNQCGVATSASYPLV